MNFFSPKKQTLQSFVIKKMDRADFCGLKKWTLPIFVVLESRYYNVF